MIIYYKFLNCCINPILSPLHHFITHLNTHRISSYRTHLRGYAMYYFIHHAISQTPSVRQRGEFNRSGVADKVERVGNSLRRVSEKHYILY